MAVGGMGLRVGKGVGVSIAAYQGEVTVRGLRTTERKHGRAQRVWRGSQWELERGTEESLLGSLQEPPRGWRFHFLSMKGQEHIFRVIHKQGCAFRAETGSKIPGRLRHDGLDFSNSPTCPRDLGAAEKYGPGAEPGRGQCAASGDPSAAGGAQSAGGAAWHSPRPVLMAGRLSGIPAQVQSQCPATLS